MRLLHPGALQLNQCSEDWGELIGQGEMHRAGCMGPQQGCGCLACFLDQPCHVVRETLRVPDFEAKAPSRLKVFLAHSGLKSLALTPVAGRDPDP